MTEISLAKQLCVEAHKGQAMWHHSKRCPECLELGKLRYQFGYYVCDKCDQHFSADWLGHFNKAFEQGRKFERERTLDAS